MNMDSLGNALNQGVTYYLGTVLPLILLLIGMIFAALQDSYIGKRHKIILYHIVVLSILLIFQNNISIVPVSEERMIVFRTANSILGYSVRPVFLILFMGIVEPERKYLPEWILSVLNAIIYMTAFFSPLTFYFNEDGAWIPGPLRNLCLFVSAFLLGELTYLTARKHRIIRRREMLIPAFCIAMIIAAIILDYNTGQSIQIVSYLTIAVIVSSLFYYIWLHLQFVREHEEDLKARQRIQIMISQIQPHFLFNSLSVAQALCDRDPHAAKRILGKLGLYLRQNIDSLESAELIPVQKELQHTRIYAEIEMERFESISIEYDTTDTDFLIPPLTIQPMVENAIRHGVRGMENGQVIVKTVKKESYHEIVVEDNGTGFDVNRLAKAEGTHIGIRNVRERIEKLCNGSMMIESRLGEGTRVVIHIPRGNKNPDNPNEE